MRLSELEAAFIKKIPGGFQHEGVAREEADGVMFLCPVCFAAAGSRPGVHSVICWFVGRVPDDEVPGPGRWNPQGHGIEDLTFVGPAAASVLLTSGCNAHFFVRNGEIQ